MNFDQHVPSNWLLQPRQASAIQSAVALGSMALLEKATGENANGYSTLDSNLMACAQKPDALH